MKKSALTLFLTLAATLMLSACGLRPSGGDDSSSGNREYDWQQDSDRDTSSNKLQQNNPSQESSPDASSEVPSSEDDAADQPASTGDTALADWYNGSDRTLLENLINSMYNDSGLSFYVTIQEPDIIIYNYKYTSQLDLSGMSQSDIDSYYTNGLDDGAADIVSDINNFRTTYGIPLTTIRMNYLNADDSLIFSFDFTEDYVPGSASGSSSSSDSLSASLGTYDSLQDWLTSEEARMIIESTNNTLASSGMTVDLAADGNIFVYEYYISDDLGIESLSQDQIAMVLDPVIESQRTSLTALFGSFESEYGIHLDGIRVVFYTAGGDKLYSADIVNE